MVGGEVEVEELEFVLRADAALGRERALVDRGRAARGVLSVSGL